MKEFDHPTAAPLGRGVSSVLTAVAFSILTALAIQARAAESSASSQEDITRTFAFFFLTPDAPLDALRRNIEVEGHGKEYITMFSQHILRYSQNFVTGLVYADWPGFMEFEEFASPKKSGEIMRAKIPEVTKATSEKYHTDRIITQSFTQRLISGPPVVDKDEPYPVRKRAIFLRRAAQSTPENVGSELAEYAQSVAKQVGDMSSRVMLYTMVGVPTNYPSYSLPSAGEQARSFDAIIMIWPKGNSITPRTFDVGPPSNYRILHDVNLQTYYNSPGN